LRQIPDFYQLYMVGAASIAKAVRDSRTSGFSPNIRLDFDSKNTNVSRRFGVPVLAPKEKISSTPKLLDLRACWNATRAWIVAALRFDAQFEVYRLLSRDRGH
jgi:hypothetical protein